MYYKPNYTREQVAPRPSGRPPYKAPAKLAEGQFDPDDLTRRLYVVLAEQKAHAERRQRTRAELSSRKDGLGLSSSIRHRNGLRLSRETREKPAGPPADLVTALRRSGSAKHNPSHTAATQMAPEDAAAPSEPYHHVPQEAAKQFTRTTTVENRRNSDLVHKLSKQALKFHTEGIRAVHPGAGASASNGGASETALSPAELTRALQQSQSHRERLLERNQFQRTRILEEAARLDHDAQLSPRSSATTTTTAANKHTFEHELARILPGGGTNQSSSSKHTRRNSTGNTDPFSTTTNPNNPHHLDDAYPHHHRHSLISPIQLPTLDEHTTAAATTTPPPEDLNRFPPADRTRVDWTQSDESRAARGGPRMLLLSPLLRKADSLWALRAGRRGSKDSEGGRSSFSSSGVGGDGKRGGGEKGVAAGEGVGNGVTVAAAAGGESPKTAGKGGFFGRFRR
jgi:hypothetical protein